MRHKTALVLYFLPLLVCLIAHPAAHAYNNTSLKWRTISTPHFEVHYHQGAEWTALETARIAEKVYPHITGLYNHAPKGKVHFIIKDTDDHANGLTFYYDNKIEIWATNLEFGLRGTSKWLEGVITHEFTHLINLQAGFKFTSRIPAIYFQLIDFEKTKRPDVLTGYPTHIASYPIAGSVIPPWFAEGTAQYMDPDSKYDCWDTHRDMILRCAVLEDRMLTYDEMGFFSHTGLGNEQVYDHGYGLVRYIAAHHGHESLREIIEGMRALHRYTFDGALKRVTGKKGSELYDGWRTKMLAEYSPLQDSIAENMKEGEKRANGGYYTISPLWGPDEKHFYFLSNRGTDWGKTSLYVKENESKKAKLLKGGVTSRPTLAPDGKSVVYSRKDIINRYGCEANDLFRYTLSNKKEKQLTKGLRSSDPSYSPDGQSIVCVLNSDGTHKLAVLDPDGTNLRVIFETKKGTQFYAPQFSPDGKEILFGIFEGSTRKIAIISAAGENFRYIVDSPNDERDPRWTPEGTGILFASDRTGIFNIYSLDLESGRISQLTNVIGGAFMPDLSPSGKTLAYSGYHGEGYSVYHLSLDGGAVVEMDMARYRERSPAYAPDCAPLKDPPDMSAYLYDSPDSLDGNSDASLWKDLPLTLPDTSAIEDNKYKAAFTPFQIYPRFIIYERKPRVGVFLASNEILDKQSFFVGASYGSGSEFDAFLSYEVRYLYPTIFVDVVRMREKYNDVVSEGPTTWDLGLRYDLWEVDLGLRLELHELYSTSKRSEFSLFYTHGEYGVHMDVVEYKYGEKSAIGNGGWKYYIGNQFTGRYRYKKVPRRLKSDVNPRNGREYTIEATLAFDRLFTSGDFDYAFRPSFDKNYYGAYSIDWIEYLALPYLEHTLQLRVYGAAIDNNVDDFFYLYLGGRDYLRGYTYYSIGGRKALLGSAMYRFPIWRSINKQLLQLYVSDIYGGVFFEAGNAWDKDEFSTTGYKKTVGGELRLNLGSFYAYPTTVTLTSAYALDTVIYQYFPEGAVAPSPIIQGKEWTTYFTLGFEF